MNNVAIIKYNAGNIQSVSFALERLGITAMVTDDEHLIRKASHVIFPGVGAANSAMPYLKERGLDTLIRSLTQPFLGICLGMQLMCKYSQEGNVDCLNIFNISITKFNSSDGGVKVPHMGWNNVYDLKSPLMFGIKEAAYCYFVHSYFAGVGEETIATSNYIQPFSAALQYNNFYGVQFHPEKSALVGEQILQNFLAL